jgi:uncharacterized iron-regulated membrane protein
VKRARNPVDSSFYRLWAFVGLAPAVIFVTGAIMWWNRVVRRRRTARDPAAEPV